MTIIMGVDPGSRVTGFGLIENIGANNRYITSGCIRLPDAPLAERLHCIFSSINEIIEQYQPQHCSVESVFMARNAGSALKLGQARGAAIVAAASCGLEVAEYSARQIKQSVVGTGAAKKEQVQHMVQTLLTLSDMPTEDAADALAAALCHAHSQQGLLAQHGVTAIRRGRMR
ncbi:MAG: crossover junction endodeoxyribonuclease RuvC [Pseudomonadales bacterium]